MDGLLRIALLNAGTAAVLALPVAAVSKLVRRAPLTRALWVLVLLKLVTPPLWSVPVWHGAAATGADLIVPRPMSVVHAGVVVPVNVRDETFDVTSPDGFDPIPQLQAETPARVTVLMPRSSAVARPHARPSEAASEANSLEPTPASATAPNATTPLSSWRAFHWASLIGVAWLVGCGIYLLAIALAAVRLRRLVRGSTPAPGPVRRRVAELAGQMGLRRPPPVVFADGPISPMLCAIAVSPRIVLPSALWEKLNEEQRGTVLAHELAHLKRRDHWMTLLELAVGVLYWWHPVVWWARRELREAAEQCCDAWVVWSMPRTAASYAAALVDTAEFISMVHPAVPALASGMGQFTDLKRRLVMIKQGNARRALSRPAFVLMCGAAGLLLPLAPSFAETPRPPAPAAAAAPIAAPVPEAAPGTSATQAPQAAAVSITAQSSAAEPSTDAPPGADNQVMDSFTDRAGAKQDQRDTDQSDPDQAQKQRDQAQAQRDKAQADRDRAQAQREAARAREQARRYDAELKRAHRDLDRAQQQLEQAAKRVAELEMRRAKDLGAWAWTGIGNTGPNGAHGFHFNFGQPGGGHGFQFTMPDKNSTTPRGPTPHLNRDENDNDNGPLAAARDRLRMYGQMRIQPPQPDPALEHRLDAMEHQMNQLMDQLRQIQKHMHSADSANQPHPKKSRDEE